MGFVCSCGTCSFVFFFLVFFLQNSFLGEVLSSQIEETSEKIMVLLHRRTRERVIVCFHV